MLTNLVSTSCNERQTTSEAVEPQDHVAEFEKMVHQLGSNDRTPPFQATVPAEHLLFKVEYPSLSFADHHLIIPLSFSELLPIPWSFSELLPIPWSFSELLPIP
jgi:hypothetical protein